MSYFFPLRWFTKNGYNSNVGGSKDLLSLWSEVLRTAFLSDPEAREGGVTSGGRGRVVEAAFVQLQVNAISRPKVEDGALAAHLVAWGISVGAHHLDAVMSETHPALGEVGKTKR